MICSVDEAGCDEQLADRVFATVNNDDVPFTSDGRPGERNLMSWIPRILGGNNPIIHEEFVDLRTSVNTTLEGHTFHPGSVAHQVHFDNGSLYYELIGVGTGSMPGFNNIVGIMLFQPGVQRIVFNYQTGSYYRKLRGF